MNIRDSQADSHVVQRALISIVLPNGLEHAEHRALRVIRPFFVYKCGAFTAAPAMPAAMLQREAMRPLIGSVVSSWDNVELGIVSGDPIYVYT